MFGIYSKTIQTFYPTFCLAYTLTFYLTFYVASILTLFLEPILAFHLEFSNFLLWHFLASVPTYSLTFSLAFYLTSSGIWLRSCSANLALELAEAKAEGGCTSDKIERP